MQQLKRDLPRGLELKVIQPLSYGLMDQANQIVLHKIIKDLEKQQVLLGSPMIFLRNQI